MSRASTFILAGTVLASCTTARPDFAGQASPMPFSPAAFFLGKTEGEGIFRKVLSRNRLTRVFGTGRVAPDGTTVLDQRIEVAGKPTRNRSWRLRSVGDGRFTGTLSDAVGAVTGDVSGSIFHVHFKAKSGYDVEQWMRLDPGGRIVLNHLVVRKFGMRVASLDETIRKVD